MKRDYNSLIQRYSEVVLPRDGAALAAELACCYGAKTVLRARQGEQRWELPGTETDPAGALLAAGLVAGEPCAVELLTRDPHTMLPDPYDRHRDRGDQRGLEEARLRRLPGARGPRGTPMFFRENGQSLDLVDLHAGGTGTIFLVLNGHSFGEGERALLRETPGIVTMGVNNGAHGFRTDLWTCVDDPARFMRSIWEDARICKFVPMSHFDRPVWDHGKGVTGQEAEKSDAAGQAGSYSRERVRDFPNVVGYRRNDAFCPEDWLWEDTVNWGNHQSRGGGRSVMLAALRLIWLLGYRRVCLVGCDFEMASDRRYWFAEGRTDAAVRNNQQSYRLLSRCFTALRPHFDRAGFRVWNCTPGSRLDAFPRMDLDRAVRAARVDTSASTEGMYVTR